MKRTAVCIGLVAMLLSFALASMGKATEQRKIEWNQNIRAGDCEMERPSLTFRSDGTGTFHCRVMTHFTHHKDYWHQSFEVKDASGRRIFHLGEWTGPAMSEQDRPIWHEWNIEFTYPAGEFYHISTAEFFGKA